jgi:hypothetical protein
MMRRTKTILHLVLTGLLAVILFSGNIQTNGTPLAGTRDKCTTVIVGKSATVDGAVLLGHNEDWGEYLMPLRWNPREKHQPGETFRLHDGQDISQVAETLAFIWPAAECNGINELQVAIADDTGSCRKELFQNDRGIDLQEFVTLALQRSRTAREAVQTMGGLIEKYGYRSYNGEAGDIFSIADPNEGWLMEVAIGGLWVAQRVPDDSFMVLANRFRIGPVRFSAGFRGGRWPQGLQHSAGVARQLAPVRKPVPRRAKSADRRPGEEADPAGRPGPLPRSLRGHGIRPNQGV